MMMMIKPFDYWGTWHRLHLYHVQNELGKREGILDAFSGKRNRPEFYKPFLPF